MGKILTRSTQWLLNWRLSGDSSYFAYVSPDCMEPPNDILSELLVFGEMSDSGRARLCFHNGASDLVHGMLIYHDHRTKVPIHQHTVSGEFVLVRSGSLKIRYYESSTSPPLKESLVTPDSLFPIPIPQGVWHDLVFSAPTLFYEFTRGPHERSSTKFADTFEQ